MKHDNGPLLWCSRCKRTKDMVRIASNGYCDECNREYNKKYDRMKPRKVINKFCACGDIIYVNGMCRHCYIMQFKKRTTK